MSLAASESLRCANGDYGVKPSWERLCDAGHQDGSLRGAAKAGIAASVGPLTRSVRDLELFFQAILDQNPWRFDPDVVYKPWAPVTALHRR